MNQQIRNAREGIPTPPDVLKHITPLGWQHISLTGDYIWTLTDGADLRPLRRKLPSLQRDHPMFSNVGQIHHFRVVTPNWLSSTKFTVCQTCFRFCGA
jgi:hypothetical protein